LAHTSAIEDRVEKGQRSDIATIIFTSGTTGRPKGVPLTQENYLLHVSGGRQRMNTVAGDIWLTMLPVWHSFERIVQYIALGNGVGLAYSKPVGAVMMKDFAEINPQYTTAVPRIWESVYATIQKKMADASPIKRGLFGFSFSSAESMHASTTCIRD
jgi:long-chain acyl-CoA synthetase